MATLKQLTSLNPYTPAEVPYTQEHLNRYLQDELKKIEFPLSVLTRDWSPNFKVLAIDATTPTSWTTAPQPLANYTSTSSSKEVYGSTLTFDNLTGVVSLNNDPNVNFIIIVKANVLVQRISGANITTAFLYLDVDGVQTLLSATYASNQTAFVQVSGESFIEVAGDAQIGLQVAYEDDAEMSFINSYFSLEVFAIVGT